MNKKYNFVFFANSIKGIVSIKTVIKLKNYKKIFIFSQKEDNWEPKYINKLKALCSKNIKLFVIKDFSFKNFLKKIKSENIDMIFAIGWRRIIEKKIMNYASIKSFVMHDSLLPKNRGFAPLNWAIINGEKKTGVSLIEMNKVVDIGNIYLQESTKIKITDNINTLNSRILKIYSKILKKFFSNIKLYLNNSFSQKKGPKNFNAKRRPNHGLINWNDKSKNIFNLVRALTKPWPGAFFVHKRKIIFVWKIKIRKKMKNLNKNCGELMIHNKKYFINCKDNLLELNSFSIKKISNKIKKIYDI